LELLYAQGGAEKVFTSDYIKSLSDQVLRLDARIGKLFLFMFSTNAFLVMAFLSPDISMSFLGVSIKSQSSVREVLLVVVAETTLAISTLSASRDVLICTAEKIASLTADAKFAGFYQLASPSAFDIKIYLPRQYERWIFPAWITRSIGWFISFMTLYSFVLLFGVGIALSFAILDQVCRSPAFGLWSYGIVVFVIGAWLVSLLSAVRLHCPLPYKDSGELMKMSKLRK
jgi:hypothetical protein